MTLGGGKKNFGGERRSWADNIKMDLLANRL
jgi:hypothetical protein